MVPLRQRIFSTARKVPAGAVRTTTTLHIQGNTLHGSFIELNHADAWHRCRSAQVVQDAPFGGRFKPQVYLKHKEPTTFDPGFDHGPVVLDKSELCPPIACTFRELNRAGQHPKLVFVRVIGEDSNSVYIDGASAVEQ